MSNTGSTLAARIIQPGDPWIVTNALGSDESVRLFIISSDTSAPYNVTSLTKPAPGTNFPYGFDVLPDSPV